MFNRITGTSEIEKTLRDYLYHPEQQPARFLATIKSRSQNLIYEGAAPFSVVTGEDGQVWALTNSDTNYSGRLASLPLSDIEYVEVVRGARPRAR